VELVSSASGNVEKTNGNTLPQTRVGEPSAAEEKKAELKRRRAEQETPEWKREYAKRSGVEGVHEALDRKTGIKNLKVRGIKAVAMAVFFKVTGWNICAAAKIALKRRKKAEKEATRKKTTVHAPKMRRLTADASRCRPPGALPARYSHRQRSNFSKIGGRAEYRIFVFAPASTNARPSRPATSTQRRIGCATGRKDSKDEKDQL